MAASRNGVRDRSLAIRSAKSPVGKAKCLPLQCSKLCGCSAAFVGLSTHADEPDCSSRPVQDTTTMALQTKKNAPIAPTAPPAPAGADLGQTVGDGDGKKKEKKVKVKRTKLAVPEGGFTSWPTNFDRKLNKPLRRVDFADETVWLDAKAAEYTKKAADLAKEAEEVRKLGPSKDRKSVKKVLIVQSELDTLKEMLKAQMGAEAYDQMVAAAQAAAQTKVDAAKAEKKAAKKAEAEAAAPAEGVTTDAVPAA
jgi:hypothetical protein